MLSLVLPPEMRHVPCIIYHLQTTRRVDDDPIALCIVKHYGSNLNTLSPGVIHVLRILERTVRCAPRDVQARVVALDEEGFIWPLCVFEVPPVPWRRLDRP